jgi:hypothetical protein
MKLKFHLSQMAIAQSTAEIVIKNVEEVVVDTRYLAITIIIYCILDIYRRDNQ